MIPSPQRPGVWLATLALIAIAIGGCNTGVAEKEAERRLRQRLPELVGPAESYRVNIRASSDLSVVKGRLRQVTIRGNGVRVANAWPVDELLVVLDKVRVDTHRQMLEEVGSARFQVLIRPPTLVRYLEGDKEEIREAAVLLERGRLTVSGRYNVLRLWTSFRVTGPLRLLDRHRIGFSADRATAAGIPVPSRIVRYLEERLNPVLDVSTTLLPVELTGITIRPDAVVVTGIPHLEDPSILNNALAR